MKTINCIQFLICLILYDCNVSHKRTIETDKTISNSNSKVSVDSIPFEKEDILDTMTPKIHLKAKKIKSGINLTYSFFNESAEHSLNFGISHFSNWVFTHKALGLINRDSFKRVDILIVGDSLLFLPLIGVNDKLSLYVINIKTEKLLYSDIRTSFDLFWINERNLKIATANSQDFTDSKFKYIYYVSQLNEIGMNKRIKDSVTSIYPIDENIDLQFRLLNDKLQ